MTEREYLENRAAVETRLATTAHDKRAAAAHRAMAAEYLNRLATAPPLAAGTRRIMTISHR